MSKVIDFTSLILDEIMQASTKPVEDPMMNDKNRPRPLEDQESA